MTSPRISLVPLRKGHIARCSMIASLSDPWKRLREPLPIGTLIGRGKNRAIVCTAGGEIAGFVIFNPSPVFARGGYLRALAVAPGFRRRGIGTLLLNRAERDCARRSRVLFLCVSSFNRSAQRFYRSCGYRKVGTLPGLVHPRHAEHLYWKILRPLP